MYIATFGIHNRTSVLLEKVKEDISVEPDHVPEFQQRDMWLLLLFKFQSP